MNMDSFGFVLTRCVKKPEHNRLWNEAIRCIWKFYPDCPVLVIDDDSDADLVFFANENNEPTPAPSVLRIVHSDYKGAAEILPYYYFWKYHPFDVAVVIQDSMFLQKPLPNSVLTTSDVIFLWHFGGYLAYEDKASNEQLLSRLKNPIKPLQLHQFHSFHGCFGTSCVISHKFLAEMQEFFGFFNLLPLIKGRRLRCSLERVFAVVCHCTYQHRHKLDPTHLVKSLDGLIFQYIGFNDNFDKYSTQTKPAARFNSHFAKVWNGR